MDRRYVEIIANNIPGKMDRKWKGVALLGMAIVLCGLLMLMAGGAYRALSGYVAALGALLFLLTMAVQTWLQSKRTKEFMTYYDATGELPPWPEDSR